MIQGVAVCSHWLEYWLSWIQTYVLHNSKYLYWNSCSDLMSTAIVMLYIFTSQMRLLRLCTILWPNFSSSTILYMSPLRLNPLHSTDSLASHSSYFLCNVSLYYLVVICMALNSRACEGTYGQNPRNPIQLIYNHHSSFCLK